MSHVDVVEAYLNGWIARDANAVLAALNADGTYEDPSSGGPVSGDAFRAYMQGLWATFPDLTFETQSVGEMGPDLVAAQWIMKGTNTGSMMGLPPTGKQVALRGADFFRMKDGRIQSVTGYFDSREVPKQLGLNIIVQPYEIGPFKFGISTSVQTGKTQEPGAFSITYLEAADQAAVQRVREGSRASLIDMLKMDGFIGATTAVIGTRMVTISAWDSPEDSRKVMKEGKHAEAQRMMFDGNTAKAGFTSVWTKHHINPPFVRCEACGNMTRGPGPERTCSCGAALPPPTPFW
jgi:steroid delta-isomerase-like uncharacterized protein